MKSLCLTGREMIEIEGLAKDFAPREMIRVRAHGDDGKEISFDAVARVDTPVEATYYQHGGILQLFCGRCCRTAMPT